MRGRAFVCLLLTAVMLHVMSVRAACDVTCVLPSQAPHHQPQVETLAPADMTGHEHHHGHGVPPITSTVTSADPSAMICGAPEQESRQPRVERGSSEHAVALLESRSIDAQLSNSLTPPFSAAETPPDTGPPGLFSLRI